MKKSADGPPKVAKVDSATPRVSIGLPVYNGAPFLREAVDSLLSQTFSDFELIICDNASDDGTAEIALEYARSDSRVRYYRNDRNLGAAANFNKTFILARGEYFKWAACDDIHRPEYLARCVEALDADRGTVLAYPRALLMDEGGRILDPCFDPLDLSSMDTLGQLHHVLWDLRSPHMVFGLVRARALAQTHLLRAHPGADVVLLGELALLGRWHQVDEVLFMNRKTDSVRQSRTRYWWDPSSESRLMLRTVRLTVNHIRAIHASPLSAPQKALLSADAFARFIIKDHRRVARDIRTALTHGYGIRAWLRQHLPLPRVLRGR